MYLFACLVEDIEEAKDREEPVGQDLEKMMGKEVSQAFLPSMILPVGGGGICRLQRRWLR